MKGDHTFACARTNRPIYLTDVFRLHERIDENLGAGGILGYLMTTIEQLIVVHILRLIARRRPAALSNIAIIKDGPLAFFGVTANLHNPMRRLLVQLSRTAEPILVGVEKSGPFVEHAHQIRDKMQPGQALILNDAYIYRNILAGSDADDLADLMVPARTMDVRLSSKPEPMLFMSSPSPQMWKLRIRNSRISLASKEPCRQLIAFIAICTTMRSSQSPLLTNWSASRRIRANAFWRDLPATRWGHTNPPQESEAAGPSRMQHTPSRRLNTIPPHFAANRRSAIPLRHGED